MDLCFSKLLLFIASILAVIASYWVGSILQANNNNLTFNVWMKKTQALENATLPVNDDRSFLSAIGQGGLIEDTDAKFATDVKAGDYLTTENNCINMRLKCLLLDYDQLTEELERVFESSNGELSEVNIEVMTELSKMFQPFILRLENIKNNDLSCRDERFKIPETLFYIDYKKEYLHFSNNVIGLIYDEKEIEILESILIKFVDLYIELVDLCDGKLYFSVENNCNSVTFKERRLLHGAKNCYERHHEKNTNCYKKEVLGEQVTETEEVIVRINNK